MAIDLTTFEKGLNLIYPELDSLLSQTSAIYNWMPKRTNWRGRKLIWRPVITDANGSAGYGASRMNQSQPEPLEAQIPLTYSYVPITVDIATMMISEGDGASESAAEAAVEAVLAQHALAFKHGLARDGTGVRGTVSSVSTDTITLTNASDAQFFRRNMYIQASATAGGTLLNAGATGQVGKISLANGTLKTKDGSNWATAIGAIAATNVLMRAGDSNGCLWGFDKWIPATAPTTDDIGGIDRSVDPERLAGYRYSATGAAIDDGIFAALADAAPNEGTFDTVFVDHRQARELMKISQARGWYEPGGKAGIGFDTFTFVTPQGRLQVIQDTALTPNTAFITRRDSWELVSAGATPHWADDDGHRWRMNRSADAIEGYVRSYANVRCAKPQCSIRVAF